MVTREEWKVIQMIQRVMSPTQQRGRRELRCLNIMTLDPLFEMQLQSGSIYALTSNCLERHTT